MLPTGIFHLNAVHTLDGACLSIQSLSEFETPAEHMLRIALYAYFYLSIKGYYIFPSKNGRIGAEWIRLAALPVVGSRDLTCDLVTLFYS